MNRQSNDESILGKRVTYKGSSYQFIPCQVPRACRGCALYHNDCPKRITVDCTQGYILERIKR